MTSITELWAAQIGWTIARTNVIVEGTSDVALLCHASSLYERAHGRPILDADFAIIAAGKGDEGGVDGVNRALNLIKQVAERDLDEQGRQRYRFVGLFDDDYNGRAAFNLASRFDPRVKPFEDVFLLRPVMPGVGNGLTSRHIEATQANLPYSGMDWEIEDLCSGRIFARFVRERPGAVINETSRNGRTHRDIDRIEKASLVRLFIEAATLEDACEFVALLKLLRGYVGMDHDFITI